MTRYTVLRTISVTLLAGFMWMAAIILLVSVVRGGECIPEPESVWAPPGWVCPPTYEVGIASTWPGPGVARNDCIYPWTACDPIRVTSLDTGLSIVVTPTMWCHCWVGVTGPLGETQRMVDLDPASVEALGLDPRRGLWTVRVNPTELLPDTRYVP